VREQFNVRPFNDDPGLVAHPEIDGYSEKAGLHVSANAASAEASGFIALIEGRVFIQECIRRSMQSAFPLRIRTFSNVSEFQRDCHEPPSLILLSALEESEEISPNGFKIMSDVAAGNPIIVLASSNDAKMARAAIYHGARGYIPVTLGFDVAVEAVRFVLAGGTYVPIEYLLTKNGGLPAPATATSGVVTTRELAVVRAIQQGKSNKIIAYELGMREGTVKVHVRRIMKKLNAKNRTDVAIKSQNTLTAFPANTSIGSPAKEFWAVQIEPVKGEAL